MTSAPRGQRICVFAGAHAGNDARYASSAAETARIIVGRGYELVYGGGSTGLMGFVADAALAAGGRVTGIIPNALATTELCHPGLTQLEVVSTMHERKARMAELSCAFVALPGGVGTYEELFEAVTLTQLGYQQKPVALLNVCGFYDGLIAFLDHATDEGFISVPHRQLFVVDSVVERIISRLERWAPPEPDGGARKAAPAPSPD